MIVEKSDLNNLVYFEKNENIYFIVKKIIYSTYYFFIKIIFERVIFMSKAVIDYIYAHIGNGGVTFKVTNDNGPTIEVEASHYGHITNSMKLHVNKETLKALGEMFLKASELESFDETYCCSTETYLYNTDSDKPIHVYDGEKKVMSFGSSSD